MRIRVSRSRPWYFEASNLEFFVDLVCVGMGQLKLRASREKFGPGTL